MGRNSFVALGKTSPFVMKKFNEVLEVFNGNYISTLSFLLNTIPFSSNQYIQLDSQLHGNSTNWTIPKKPLIENLVRKLDVYKEECRFISRSAALEQLLLGTGISVQKYKLHFKDVDLSEIFSLKFDKCRKSNKFCDVTIAIEGKKFSCHKIILTSISEYFEELFNENSTNSIEISDITDHSFEEILDFIYTGKLTLDNENFETTLQLAEKFKLQKLKDVCKIYKTFTQMLDNTNEEIAEQNEDQKVIKRSRQVPIIPFTRSSERKAKKDAYATISQALANMNDYELSSPFANNIDDNIISDEKDYAGDVGLGNSCLALPLKKRTNDNFNSIETGDFKLVGSTCDITFTGDTAYNLRLTSQNNSNFLNKCEICAVEKNSVDELQDHMNSVHPNEINSISGLSVCEICSQSFKTTNQLSVHMKTHFPSVAKQQKSRTCRVCGKEFKSHLTRHMITHSGKRTHCCTTCGKLFLKSDHLKRHERIHSTERPFTCEECGKTFRDKDHLKRHHLTHTEERPYFCEVCGKQFKDKSTLLAHQKSHTSASMACPICGKMFKTQERLDSHTAKHSSVKPHVCEVCGKKFPFNGRLRKHMLSHTGDRPYHCETCGKQFRDSHSLRLHQKTHTGIGLHPCLECDKKFTNAFHLKRHARVHTGEKPYQCDVCNKRFGRNDNFEVHRRNCAVNFQLKQNLSEDFQSWNPDKNNEKNPTSAQSEVSSVLEEISAIESGANFDRFREMIPEQIPSFTSLLSGTYNNKPEPTQRRMVPIILQNNYPNYNNRPPTNRNYEPVELLPHQTNPPMQSGTSGQLLYNSDQNLK